MLTETKQLFGSWLRRCTLQKTDARPYRPIATPGYGCRVLHCRVGIECFFEGAKENPLTLVVELISLAAKEVDVAIGVHSTDVARVEPAIPQGGGR